LSQSGTARIDIGDPYRLPTKVALLGKADLSGNPRRRDASFESSANGV